MKVGIWVWPEGSDGGFRLAGVARLVDGEVVADREIEGLLEDPIPEPATGQLVHRAEGERYLRLVPSLFAHHVRTTADFLPDDDVEIQRATEVYTPADSADYLGGPMPKYSEKDGGHLFEFRGKTINLNTLEPFGPQPKKKAKRLKKPRDGSA